MAEYIEREAFVESQHNIYCVNCDRRKDSKGKFVYFVGDAPCRACGIMDVLDAVEDFPAADVRPVVLCRDCIFRSNEWTGCPKLNGTITGDEFFCAGGVKREES